MSAPPITHHVLPALLREVAEATGSLEIALAVARVFADQEMYLPREPKKDHPLAKRFGLKVARLICARIGGERADGKRLTWPTASPALRAIEARELAEGGVPNREISRRLGISKRQVRRLIQGVEKGDANAGQSPDRADACCPVCGRRRRAARLVAGEDPRQLAMPEVLGPDICPP
ncbi:helix-turn-helix domain-containing protein [Zavarzinia aquatilis]|nr:helix-turn-helix domain-containing protein [Zavarzinia aquatilis]